jgi:TPP-dependent pyruvate/acetoin dehydrogenase alpha subunit
VKSDDLIAFEKRVAEAFANKECKGPVHLSGGNEQHLIEIFKDIQPDDWVVSNYRSHYHALLHGIDPEWLMEEIRAGRSMNIHNPERRFISSAIVGGCLPIAVGIAASLRRKRSQQMVWCFLGDMAATTGAYSEAYRYAEGWSLPIEFIIEDNGYSTNTPTKETWGPGSYFKPPKYLRYGYERQHPHVGLDKWVQF